MFQKLEKRLLLAVTAVLKNGVLTIEADKRPNVITLAPKGNKLVVTTSAGVQRFTRSQVDELLINTGAGNDKISFPNVNIPSTVNAGSGHDTIVGGGAVDEINAGSGNDHVTGRGGADGMGGGLGTDTLIETVSEGFSNLSDVSLDGDEFDSFERANLTTTGGLIDASKFSGDVTLNGSEGDDCLFGGLGDDKLFGKGGYDNLSGGAGNDLLVGASGKGGLDGGLGLDTVQETFRTAVLAGSSTSAVLFGVGPVGDVDALLLGIERVILLGTSGNDTLNASGFTSDVEIKGNAGNDKLYGGKSQSFLHGGEGKDELIATSNFTVFFGGPHNDTLRGTSAFESCEIFPAGDLVLGKDSATGEGRDTLLSIELVTVRAGAGANRLDRGDFPGDVRFFAGKGNDTLIGGDGDTSHDGGPGDDLVIQVVPGGAILGDSEGDNISGTLGFQNFAAVERIVFDASAATSKVQIDPSTIPIRMTLLGGSGDDILVASRANCLLDGGKGNDRLTGNTGNDRLLGGGGNDSLFGNQGNDTLLGAKGIDSFSGGPGKDDSDKTAGES